MDALLGWLLWLPLLLVVLLGWYLSYSAARLDRLHHRVEASQAALEAQLARRAAAAVEVASLLPPAGRDREWLAGAAADAVLDPGGDLSGPRVREDAENRLTKALHGALDDPAVTAALRRDTAGDALLTALSAGCRRVQLARRFHNDAVAHAQRMRRKRVVRWARLAGRAELPQMVEIDDSIPTGLDPHPLPGP